MTRTLVAAAAIVGILSLGPTHAADLPRATPVYKAPPAPTFSWTGCYVGGNVGWIGNDSKVTTSPAGVLAAFPGAAGDTFTYGIDGSDVAAGVQYGCNMQFGSWVLGLDSDFNWSGLDDGVTASVPARVFLAHTENLTQSLEWYSTTRARIGYAWDRWMVFAAGGLASGRIESDYTWTAAGFLLTGSQNKTRYGWTVGGGIEYALNNNWFLRGEYMYVDLGDYNYNAIQVTPPVPASQWNVALDNQFHVARVALSYRFTGAGSLWEWAARGFKY